MRLFPALLLLAACSGDAAERARPAALAAPAPQPPELADGARFLDLDTLRWSEWETEPLADRLARLRELGITPVRDGACEMEATQEHDPCGERAADFRFVDLTGDGVDDVVYQGPWFEHAEHGFAAAEGTRLKIYRVRAGRATRVLDHHGSVQRIWKGGPGEPVAFRTVHHGCCADPAWTIEYFRPVGRGNEITFELHHRVLGRSGIELPERFLAAQLRFRVASDRYLLRAAPRIADADEADDWQGWEGRGNALAEYGRGARGTAMAERTDDTGRVWWFVRMDGDTPPRDAQLPEPEGHERVAIPADRVGWMSSRFAEVEP
jgi:hypothetical protein